MSHSNYMPVICGERTGMIPPQIHVPLAVITIKYGKYIDT